jgi:glycosyltransferase involved in cell wall biosynthesis
LDAFAAMAARPHTGKPLVVKPSTAGAGTKLGAYARARWAAPLLAAGWRRVDAWVAISEQIRADLIRMGAPAGRVVSIPNGVDTGVFQPPAAPARHSLRGEFGLTLDEQVIVTAARLTAHKKVDLLLGAFLELAPRFPRARLWILGAGEQRRDLEAMAASSPHGGRVRLWEPVGGKEIARYFQAADVFCLLSLWEGLSNALLEAMACGLPAVVSDVSGMAEVVRDEETGFVVVPGSQDAAVRALIPLLEDAGLRQRMGTAGSADVSSRFGLDRTARRLIDLYAACIERRPPRENE